MTTVKTVAYSQIGRYVNVNIGRRLWYAIPTKIQNDLSNIDDNL